jgi:hypothetical protein
MFRDPIVEEVRRHREENAKFGFDVRKIAEDAIRRQGKSGHRVVDLSAEGVRKRKTVRSRKRSGSVAEG